MLEPPPRPAAAGLVQRTAVSAPHRRVRFARSPHLALLPEPAGTPVPPSADEVLRCGDLMLDVSAHQAFVGTEPLALSHLQFVLLAHLVRNADRVVPAGELVAVAAAVGPTHPRTIASAVSRLRSRLGHGPQRPTIAVSRARGYELRKPPAHLVGV